MSNSAVSRVVATQPTTSSKSHRSSALDNLKPLHDAGFALHHLHPATKRPIGNDWSTVPVASWKHLTGTYRTDMNVGVRLGEPSRMVSGGYLQVLDIDIRDSELADEAWAALTNLLPNINPAALPSVASGSGGESRHLYFTSDHPLATKMLAHADGKIRTAKGSWSWTWEIQLLGTGAQVVAPPSIHPDTGLPYRWEREFDWDMLDLGIAPHIPMADLFSLGAAEHQTFGYESREPLDLKPGQMERELGQVDVSELDYDDWVRLGQAIHHQTGGSDEGFDLWLEHTKRSTKFTGDRQARDMRRSKWRSFGRYRGAPVTFATVRQWAADARQAALVAEFDDLDDMPAAAPVADEFDDLLGDVSTTSDNADDMDAIAAAADAKDPLLWVSLLDVNDEGAIRPTLHNLRLIVENDDWTRGVMAFNQFTKEVVQRGSPGLKKPRRKNPAKPTLQLTGPSWTLYDSVNGDFWTGDKDNGIRALLEAPRTQGGYGIKVPDRDLRSAIDIVGRQNGFHPVREYLRAQIWDGKPRVESLFSTYLGAGDDSYTRDVSRLMLLGAVTRIYEPGHKFDFAVIIEGLQGKRKSTFIKVLGRSWFAELNGDFHDSKQMIELMQGAWIMEIPELSGFRRGEVQTIKAFISTTKDRARLAYAARADEFKRQCIFIGSTNDREYLKDDTGGRRFWPMMCTVDEIDTAALERNIDQIWAEAVVLYRRMRKAQPVGDLPLYLADPASREIAVRLQESRRAENADDGMAGQIEAWLDRPIVSGLMDNDDGTPVMRDRVCLKQIWTECLGAPGRYDQAAAQALGRSMRKVSGWTSYGTQHDFPAPYGPQRFYERITSAPEWRSRFAAS